MTPVNICGAYNKCGAGAKHSVGVMKLNLPLLVSCLPVSEVYGVVKG
jgi:hypothetical protein